jgi:hypothetical protein
VDLSGECFPKYGKSAKTKKKQQSENAVIIAYWLILRR